MLYETFRNQVRALASAPVQVNGGNIGMMRCTREVLVGVSKRSFCDCDSLLNFFVHRLLKNWFRLTYMCVWRPHLPTSRSNLRSTDVSLINRVSKSLSTRQETQIWRSGSQRINSLISVLSRLFSHPMYFAICTTTTYSSCKSQLCTYHASQHLEHTKT